MNKDPWKEGRDEIAKGRASISRQKYLSTPPKFSELLQKRNETIQSMKGKAIPIKLKMTRQILSMDEELDEQQDKI